MDYKAPRAKEIWYKGQWSMNVREGQGTLQMKDRNTYTVSNFMELFQFRALLKITGQMANARFYILMELTMKVKSLKEFDMAKEYIPKSFKDKKAQKNLKE